MLRRITIATGVLLAVASLASGQIGWDKHRPTKPLPNPSPVNGTRERIVSTIKTLLERNAVPIKEEGVNGGNGSYVISTEPVVFARGLVAPTQLGHFAETKSPALQNAVRGRVTLKIEISPSAPDASLVGVFGTFEGMPAGTNEWVAASSRGNLEDRVLRYLVTAVAGQTPDDGGGDDLLDTSGAGTKTP